jgi:transposase
VDGSGRLLAFILTGGEVHDSTQAANLLDAVPNPIYVVCDKAFDTNAIIQKIRDMGAIPVIPPKSNRKNPQKIDHVEYKRRNLIERLFSRLKHFRRIATRYDKLLSRYASFLFLLASFIWVSH